MSQHSEILGSFIRNGNFPLEADYIFESEQALKDFYNDPINKTTLHLGLFKIVNDGTTQHLYWVNSDDEGNLYFEKLIGEDSLLQDTYYDEDTNSLILVFKTGEETKTVSIALSDLLNVKNFVKYKDFGENRKTIELKNYDSISGISTSGTGHNLVMLSKWNVADFGSPSVPINLNGSSERPTYNDNKDIALLEDLDWYEG